MKIRMFTSSFVVAAFIFAIGFAGSTSAQGTVATPSTEGAMAHPAHIHTGSCDTLGEVVFPLENVAPVDMMASPEAMMHSTPMAMDMADAGEMTAESTTVVEVSLDDILAAEHAINVHESAENIQNYIACGDITGSPTDGELSIELQELNDSGYMGHALLVDNGDDTTTVTITLKSTDMTATPEASPAT